MRRPRMRGPVRRESVVEWNQVMCLVLGELGFLVEERS